MKTRAPRALGPRALRGEDFGPNSRAAKYRGVLKVRSEAFERLLRLLNDPANEQRLVDAESLGLPALAGVVRFIESDPVMSEELAAGDGSHLFRQAIGAAVGLKMERFGWSPTGTKGSVSGARHFFKADHYAPEPLSDEQYQARALAVRDELCRIGDEAEREESRQVLMEALERTRAEEGRPF